MINEIEVSALNNLHDELQKSIPGVAKATCVAGFILASSCIVLFCSLLCLNLPGINAINDVLLPAVLPASCGILLSIPFVCCSVKRSENYFALRERIITKLFNHLNCAPFERLDPKEKVDFMLNHFINPDWHFDYKRALFSEVKAKFTALLGKEEAENHPTCKALQDAQERIGEELRAKKKKED